MPLDDDLLNDVADAILDGNPIDWNDVAARAAGRDRRLIDRLKILQDLASLHRAPAVDASNSTEPARSSEVTDHDAARGRRWGHLTLLELVGRGAYGEVYRARDTRLDRDVALKLLPVDAGETRASSIIEEGRLLARVRHSNVVIIYGAERRGSQVGLWMEFIDGRTLEQILQEGKRFTVAETVDIGIQLCDAVAAVHTAGLLHRDIKSQNVMLAENGRAVLMDFGTGRDVADESVAGVAGTPLYLAPELLSGCDPSVQSDLYSLGVILYHLLTHSYPVRADSLRELRRAHGRAERGDLRRARPDVPPKVARIIERALTPEPADRYSTARSFAAELAALRRRQPRVSMLHGIGAAAVLVAVAWLPSLSNIARPGERPATSSATMPATPPVRSIAVLPFEAVDAAQADEPLQHGMTEAVIAQLSHLRTVRVEPLTRVRAYRAASPGPLEAGRALGVDAVLLGHVQQAGSGVEVRLQLLRTADGAVLTGNHGSQNSKNMVEAQSRVIRTLATALDLNPAERSRLDRQETSSAEAFRHYSFGRYHLEIFNLERMRQAESEFREAIRLDPQYARAHASLALTLLNTVWLGGRRGIEIRDSAEASALRAIELDESVALSHTVLAHLYQYLDFEPFKAQREHLRAMALDDQDLSVLRAYSFFLLHHDAVEEALAVHRRTIDLDPASPLSTKITAEMLYVARRYDECVGEGRRAAALEPNDANMLLSLFIGRCLEQQGRQREAVDVYEAGRAARGDTALAAHLRRVYAASGWEGYWRERVRTTAAADPGVGAAALHARLGNIDERDARIAASRGNPFAGRFLELPGIRSAPRRSTLSGASSTRRRQRRHQRAACRDSAGFQHQIKPVTALALPAAE